jgi:glycine betaine/proline transport system substrate-binding protein
VFKRILTTFNKKVQFIHFSPVCCSHPFVSVTSGVECTPGIIGENATKFRTGRATRRRRVKKLTGKLVAGAFATVLALGSFAGAASADSNEPIKIPIKNWSSQIVMAHVIGGMFESMGSTVEYVPVDNQASFEAVRAGDLTILHEVWQSTMQNAYYNAMEKGGLIDAGTHEAATLEEMGVPNWVIDQGLCPGLPKWEALKDCSANFATPDSGGKGRWLEGPQSWHGDVMPNRIKGLGLDDKWVVKFAGAADALWAELEAAKKEGRGTVIFNWSPNFTDASGFTFIEFPPYFDGCRMADGGDLSSTGCGSPAGWLKKGANYKFPKTHPKAYAAFSKLSFTTPQIGSMAALVDVEKMTHADAAVTWLKDNEDVWKPWTVSVLGEGN